MSNDIEEAKQLLENSQKAQLTYFNAIIRIIERQQTKIKHLKGDDR